MTQIPYDNRAWAYWRACNGAFGEIAAALNDIGAVVVKSQPESIPESDLRRMRKNISMLTQKFNLLQREQNRRVRQ
ncbi:MAG: hypothetical protein P4K83_02250 [Terracidiphilus sp.]|nr:hypothetical protein [Terracidiphilus sp.]